VDPQKQELAKVMHFLANYDIGKTKGVTTPTLLNTALTRHSFRNDLWLVIADLGTIIKDSTPATMLERTIGEAVKGTARSKTAAAGKERNSVRPDAELQILTNQFLAWVTPPLIEHYHNMQAGGRLQLSSNCGDSERDEDYDDV
jgi:hypothetical protein